MQAITLFNPAATLQRMELENGQLCLVIDDALQEPERMVAWAAEHRPAFRSMDSYAYPGVYLPVPGEVEAEFAAFFGQHVQPWFDAGQLLHMNARLAMVTTPPSALRPCQWLCHADNFGVDPALSIQAAVLYLFDDPSLGGTSFYESTLSMRDTQQLFADSLAMPSAVFARRYGLQPGYLQGTNAYFRQVGSVPARWNRLVFYDGAMLHSGDIGKPDRLTDDPRMGRLTLNGFFTCRRQGR
jgi:hypothetical protein